VNYDLQLYIPLTIQLDLSEGGKLAVQLWWLTLGQADHVICVINSSRPFKFSAYCLPRLQAGCRELLLEVSSVLFLNFF